MPPLLPSRRGPAAAPRRAHLGLGLCGALALASSPLSAQVRLNELVAATNARLTLPDSQGRERPGTGPFWADLDFSAPGWRTGAAPLGFGGASGLGTNVAALMQNRCPSLYLRHALTLSPAQLANEGQLQLRVRFDDAFIAYLNGREVARANAGPPGHFLSADQKAYNFALPTNNSAYTPSAQPGTAPSALSPGLTYPLGAPSSFLQPGENVLALHLINRDPNLSARIDAQLEIVPANALATLALHNFNDANDSASIHRNLSGSSANSTQGTFPPQSWLALAPTPQSNAAWSDLTLRSELTRRGGYANTGALRYSYSQADPANQAATLFGPPLPLSPLIPPGSLTSALLANLRLNFRFRASPSAAFALRLDPLNAPPSASLSNLAPLNPSSGSGPAQDPPDAFDDAANGLRSRAISPSGSLATNTSGSLRNILNFYSGPATRAASFSLRENNAPGSGFGPLPGALQFDVLQAPATFDSFGFSYQPLVPRSWSPGAITPAQLASAILQFDFLLPQGLSFQVYLEPTLGSPTPADRLNLGPITGSGTWSTASLDPSNSSNQSAFLAHLNSLSSNSVALVFLTLAPLPSGSRLTLDNIGFSPWRSYSAPLSSGSNAPAFLIALNALPSPQFLPAFEKIGAALAPASASATLDDFSLTLTKPNAGSPATLLPFAAPNWLYTPGLAEPSGGLVEPADFALPSSQPAYADWIELFNPDPFPLDLSGWSLTDDPSAPRKFVFPPGTSIAPSAALLVLADDRPAPSGAAYLHAPFSLNSSGEYLALHNPSGAVVDALDPGFPPQSSFYSWGRDPASLRWGFLRQASPGLPNRGPSLEAQASPPLFSPVGGFHSAPLSLSLTSSTPGGSIRFTTDGSDPTPTNGFDYAAPLPLTFLTDRSGHVIKARSFAPGLLPSPVETHTYLINQHSNLRSSPAVLLSGDPGKTFYKPLGIFAIQGGNYSDGLWTAASPSDYHLPLGDGRLTDPTSDSRPYERPTFLEYCFPDNRPGLREPVGLRVSSSPYSRARLVLSDPPSKTLWDPNPTLKPSLNLFFRSDYGPSSIHFPLIPESPVQHFQEFRLRAGKNDITTPFIRDEFTRRLWTDLGHQGSVGTFASLYLNASFKGYYNLVERLREPFMQSHHHSQNHWDVNYIGLFEDGDALHWNGILQPRLNANLTLKANYDALRQVLDLENVADYILLNTYCAMWDWPHNNWAMARERSPSGLWRCYVWDAEGAFNVGAKGPSYPTLNLDLLAPSNTSPIPTLFRRLVSSAEFRLLFADRIHKHLFNSGALTEARTSLRRAATQAEVAPLMALAGFLPDSSWFSAWTHPLTGRRAFLFPSPSSPGQFRDPNQDSNLSDSLWPLTLPPVFSQHGGSVSPAFSLAISHSAPPGSSLYFTTDNSDPRLYGGSLAPSAQLYSAPFPLPASSTTLKARVRNLFTSEWSPLTEAHFAQNPVPASPANTVVAEIMYNPPALTPAEAAAGFTDKEDFEFLALQNIGPSPIDLAPLRFQGGIAFSFASAPHPILDPGQRSLLAKNAAALRARYGPAIDPLLNGEFSGNLNNAGEEIRLESTAASLPLRSFTYSDAPPWPRAPDGSGPSLLLRNPLLNPDHSLPASWTASPPLGGQPSGSPLNPAFPQWTAWAFSPLAPPNPSAASPQADPDADGLPNLVEYLLATDPLLPDSPLQWLRTSSPEGLPILQVTLPRLPSLSPFSLQLQSSSDLISWSPDFSLARSSPLPDGRTLQSWQKILPPHSPRHFLRLRAQSNP